MTLKLGLTGSIGMGKSTTAKMFADFGIPVWDADAAVHRLYSRGGAAVSSIKQKFPAAIVDDEVSRQKLKQLISVEPTILSEIEKIVHPLVALDRQKFMEITDSDIVIFDIPLLFETGGNRHMDLVACVNVDFETQRDRVLQRGTMTQEQFEQIRSKQHPNDLKCQQSDFIIQTDSFEHTRAQVAHIIDLIRKEHINA